MALRKNKSVKSYSKKNLLPLEKSNCNFLQNAVAIVDAYGKIKPCCAYGADDTVLSVSDVDSLDDVLISGNWNNIKQNIKLSKKKFKPCTRCWDNEKLGIDSLRQYAYKHNDALDQIIPNKIQYLELALDYTCNMMCRMCRPACSSKWYSAKQVNIDLEAISAGHFRSHDLNPKEYSEKLNHIIENTDLSNLRTLQLVGGEPFYSKNFPKLMEKINKETNISKLNFMVTTNASIVPTDYFSLFEKFREIKIFFSIDAIGDLANCIRWGVDFSVIDRNIDIWKSLNHNNIRFATHSTINLQNCNKIDELLQWNKDKGIAFCPNSLTHPTYLKLNQLPLDVRKKFSLSKKLFKEIDAYENTYKILFNSYNTENKLAEFIKSCDILDSYQGINFKSVNPEIYNLAKKYAVY